MKIKAPIDGHQNVAIIGATGSGKTCFIAALRWLGECGENSRFTSDGANGDSKRYLDDLHGQVNAGYVPRGTPGEFALEFGERYRFADGKPPARIDFTMRDFKGGYLHDLDADSPLFQFWTQCGLVMVLLDIEKIRQPGSELQDNLRDLASVLIRNEMATAGKRLAIILTQADKGGFTATNHASEAAEALLKAEVPEFLSRISSIGFQEVRCFLLASIGAEPEQGVNGMARIPEVDGRHQLRPFGYEELFNWICAFRRNEAEKSFAAECWRKVRPCLMALAVLAAAGGVAAGVALLRRDAAVATYENSNASLDEKAAATRKMWNVDRAVKIDERIVNYDRSVDEAQGDETELRKLRANARKFFEKVKLSEEDSRRVDEIDRRLAGRLEEILLARIKTAMGSEDVESTRKLIGQYLTDVAIAREHQGEVEEIDRQLNRAEKTKAKLEIAGFDVGDAGNTTRMNKKLGMIDEFRHFSPEERKESKIATDAMRRLMLGSFTLMQINAEGLEKKRNSYVLVATGVTARKDLKQYYEDGEGIPVKTQIVDNNHPQWNDESLGDRTELNWKPGQSIRVEWRRDSFWSDKCIASSTYMGDDWLGLLKVLQPMAAMTAADYGNFKLEGPQITIRCKEFPDAERDMTLIERYILPGTYWFE